MRQSIQKTFLVLLATALLTGCDSEEQSAKETVHTEDTTVAEMVPQDSLLADGTTTEAVAAWSEFYNDEAGLKKDSFMRRGEIEQQFYTRDITPAEADGGVYKRLFVYSPDSSKYIDLFSYSYIIEKAKDNTYTAMRGEPDQEVGVVDKKTNKRTRIFFCGPSCTIQKAYWYNKDVVALLGVEETESRTYKPFLQFIDLASSRTIQYDYSQKLGSQPGDYIRKEMKAAGISLAD